MHYYIVFQQLSVKVLKSLISDPLPRMSFFLFLSAFLLSCFVYKFLRRFESRFFEYHLDDDAYENFIGSAATNLAEPNVWCVNLIPFGNDLDSSAVNYSPYKNSFIPENFSYNPSSIQNSHHQNCTYEDCDL